MCLFHSVSFVILLGQLWSQLFVCVSSYLVIYVHQLYLPIYQFILIANSGTAGRCRVDGGVPLIKRTQLFRPRLGRRIFHPSLQPMNCLSRCLSVDLSVALSQLICLSLCLSIDLSVALSLNRSVCRSVSQLICLSLSLAIRLFCETGLRSWYCFFKFILD